MILSTYMTCNHVSEQVPGVIPEFYDNGKPFFYPDKLRCKICGSPWTEVIGDMSIATYEKWRGMNNDLKHIHLDSEGSRNAKRHIKDGSINPKSRFPLHTCERCGFLYEEYIKEAPSYLRRKYRLIRDFVEHSDGSIEIIYDDTPPKGLCSPCNPYVYSLSKRHLAHVPDALRARAEQDKSDLIADLDAKGIRHEHLRSYDYPTHA